MLHSLVESRAAALTDWFVALSTKRVPPAGTGVWGVGGFLIASRQDNGEG